MSDQLELLEQVQLRDLCDRIKALEEKQSEILETMRAFIDQAQPVINEIVPMIDNFTNVPVIRMALGLKKGETLSGKR